MNFVVIGIVLYVVFVFSTTCHEAAHALAAKLGGDLTAYAGGQVSLDPIPHIRREPVGMVVVPLVAYALGGWIIGWASTPFDPYWAHRHPKRAALMSLAGPGTNLALAVIAALLIRVGLWLGWFVFPQSVGFTSVAAGAAAGATSAAALILSVLFSLNVLLWLFNLMPIPPMDGWGTIPLFLSDDGIRKFQQMSAQAGGLSLIGLLVAWNVFPHIFWPVFFFIIKLLYPEVTYS